jgi:glycosyltransferase involved in cell wall biosynthesis
MINKDIIIFLIFLKLSPVGINIVGWPLFSDGLGRLPIALIDAISDDVEINFIKSYDGKINTDEISEKVLEVILKKNNIVHDVSILFSAPSHIGAEPFKKVPESKIKLAYSMLEATQIPKKWVDIFNKNFDAVIVPDNFLVDVYENSGVKKPIFVVPCILYLEDFLKQPLKKKKNKVFRFGISAAFGVEKNHMIVLEAFAQEFGNNPKLSLHIHGRWGYYFDNLKQKIDSLGLKNVELINKNFSHQEYLEFFKNLDCFVLLSRGEGFSITPRESLALGIPCILSYHTAHKTICDANMALPVNSDIKCPIYYNIFEADCGYQLTCTVKDAQAAMKKMYLNYENFINNNDRYRKWAEQYLATNIKQKYLNLIKPKIVLFGDKNLISCESLTTNSKELFNKYLEISQKENSSEIK